jgi:pilus assembly protein CpaE
MGNLDNMFELDAGRGLTLPGGVFIVANDVDIVSLRTSSSADVFESATLVALPADAPLPDRVIAQARVLVLEVNPRDTGSVRRLSQVRSARAGLPIIAAIQDADISLVRTLVRQGIADVAVLPFAAEELASQILDASARIEEAASDAALAPMVTVVRSTGGSGATSVITHLAAAMAQGDRKVCVVDLDVQCGEVGSYLGRSPKVTVADLLEAGDRLDREFLRSALTDSGRGFSLIAAPGAIMPLENVDVDQVLRLLRLVRDEFDYVLVDLPANWTSWALSVAVGSNEVLMITDLSIAGLRQAKRRIELLKSVGLPAERLGVVINRVERKLFKPVGVSEVREALNCEVKATLAAEGPDIASAQDQGLLVTEVSPRSRFGANVRALAGLLASEKG